MDTTRETTTDDSLLDAGTEKLFLARLAPHLRRIVQDVDPSAIDVFDAAFQTSVTEKVNQLQRSGREPKNPFSQEMGFEEIAIDTVLSLATNIAAALVLENVRTSFPKWWIRLVPGAFRSPRPRQNLTQHIEIIIVKSGLSEGDKERVRTALADDATLQAAIKGNGEQSGASF